jgi:hypothetical protein
MGARPDFLPERHREPASHSYHGGWIDQTPVTEEVRTMTTSLDPTTDNSEPTSARHSRTWLTGAVITAAVGIFLGADVVTRISNVAFSREEITALGFSADKATPIGWALLPCLVVFLIPRTAVLGGLGLTAYLGGAVTATFRADKPLATVVLTAVYVCVLLWTGLILRRPEPLRVLGIQRQ